MSDPVIAVVFYLFSAITVLSALGVVLTRNIIYSAVFLVASFSGVAGLFVLLNADFLAAVQLLIYAGAIAILIIFAIMMTHNTARGSLPNEQKWPAFILAAVMLVVLLVGLGRTVWPLSSLAPLEATTEPLGRLLLNEYALPFEIVSVLLVVAMIGAIVISRED
ncbi:MAG: NADH-quinone oxidoreductase subunit J [Dehalococcoidia bacterium]|nr:NADH-quinone oxidoreductase subunit J [Dehalococcoidia bacterium]